LPVALAGASAQEAAVHATPYRQTNLVANHRGVAQEVDIHLTNASSIAYLPGQPFFVTNERAGTLRVYDPAGFEEIPGVLLVSPPEADAPPTRPTAVVANPTSDFAFAALGDAPQYMVAAENGTISGWAELDGDFEEMTDLALDHSKQGDEYEGMAILTNTCCEPVLAVTDAHHARVMCLNVAFVPFECPEGFVDRHLPAHYAPYGIQQIGSEVYVTYVEYDSERLHPVAGEGKGIVDVFDWQGKFLRRFATGGSLNEPWAVVKAPAQFGGFANDILVGNFGDGSISAFDEKTGALRGQLTDAAGKLIVNPGLRGLVFGSRGTGDPNTLYFTAGPDDEPDGLLGAIVPVTESAD
jgi:uncharacterized protein (TIGR03118 family)